MENWMQDVYKRQSVSGGGLFMIDKDNPEKLEAAWELSLIHI